MIKIQTKNIPAHRYCCECDNKADVIINQRSMCNDCVYMYYALMTRALIRHRDILIELRDSHSDIPKEFLFSNVLCSSIALVKIDLEHPLFKD